MKNLISEKYKTILFHLFLWSTWLYLPLSNATEAELFDRAVAMVAVIFLTHIPLFFVNANWLVPQVFFKKGTTAYVLSLLAVIAVFGTMHYFIREWTCTQLVSWAKRPKSLAWNFVPLVLVAAISTGYALLGYFSKEEKLKHAKNEERLQSELAFLRSQISPHFIFNVLNSIVYLIRSKSEQAEAVTIKLSELMRYMLYESANAQIPLEKELGYLTNYISLQKLRFEDDIEVNFRVEGAAAGQIIEPMLMIPFVENAFKHGTGMVENPVIDIDLIISESKMSFSVKNKIAPETAFQKDESSGIGLKNVRRRLELLYPKNHHLEVSRFEFRVSSDQPDLASGTQNSKHKTQNWFLVQLDLTFLNEKNHDA